ncbi:MAG TPA: hypothetical protein VEC93_03655, partial [Anaerolineae bacterium]|nr:hypothetical protein [Anaerolineae bacterium]
MNQSYSQELRADTSRIIIPALTLAVLLISLIFVVASSSFWDVSHFWLCVILGPVSGWISWRLIKRDRYNLGIFIFFLVQYIMLTVILYEEWQPGSPVPYLFGVLIVASAMLSRAENSFLAWGAATFFTLAVVLVVADSSFSTFRLMAAPIVVNLALAGIAFLS